MDRKEAVAIHEELGTRLTTIEVDHKNFGTRLDKIENALGDEIQKGDEAFRRYEENTYDRLDNFKHWLFGILITVGVASILQIGTLSKWRGEVDTKIEATHERIIHLEHQIDELMLLEKKERADK